MHLEGEGGGEGQCRACKVDPHFFVLVFFNVLWNAAGPSLCSGGIIVRLGVGRHHGSSGGLPHFPHQD